MKEPVILPYRIVTVSGSLGVGTTTLAQKLYQTLGWKYVNAGEVQRVYDIQHNLQTNRDSALSRTDEHEREIEHMTQRMLESEKQMVYEAWLAGFLAKDIKDVFKILVVCSNEAVRIDRLMNRDDMTRDEAKKYLRMREDGNLKKWHKLYGSHSFWDPKHYNLVIDTYSQGPMETLGKVLDKIGYSHHI